MYNLNTEPTFDSRTWAYGSSFSLWYLKVALTSQKHTRWVMMTTSLHYRLSFYCIGLCFQFKTSPNEPDFWGWHVPNYVECAVLVSSILVVISSELFCHTLELLNDEARHVRRYSHVTLKVSSTINTTLTCTALKHDCSFFVSIAPRFSRQNRGEYFAER